METERPDAIFRDPYARRLAGERGEAIVRALPKGTAWAWPMIVRTAVMDEVILRSIREDGVRCVLNLAAGLDTRAYRLPLSASVRWVHVDLPEMVRYVQEQLAGEQPACALEYVAADLTDPAQRLAVFTRAGSAGGPALVVSEGLLVYLEPEQVASLARELAAQAALRLWLIDLASPQLLKMLRNKWQPQLAAANAPMRFAPAEGTRFFEPCGWREAEFRPIFEESRRLKRGMRGAWLWSLLGRLMPKARQETFRRMSGVVLLERRA